MDQSSRVQMGFLRKGIILNWEDHMDTAKRVGKKIKYHALVTVVLLQGFFVILL